MLSIFGHATQSPEETLLYIKVAGISFLVTYALYYVTLAILASWNPAALKCLSTAKRKYFVTCIVSDIHAVIVSGLATYALWTGTEMHNDYIWGRSLVASLACSITVGYMFADGLLAAIYWKEIGNWSFIFHHIVSAISFIYVTCTGSYRFFAMVRLLAEYSTLFVNLRSMLYDLGMQNGAIYFYNGLIMVASFACARILPLPAYLYCVYSILGTDSYNNSGFGRVIVWSSIVLLDTLNFMWFRKMIKGAVKVWASHTTPSSAERQGAESLRHTKRE